MASKRWCYRRNLWLVVGLSSFFTAVLISLGIDYDVTEPEFTFKLPEVTTLPPHVVTSLDGRITSLLTEEDRFVVPNVVHYVWFGEYERLRFHQMLSILSVTKIIKPDEIIFHCDNLPRGQWWKYVNNHVKNMTVVKLKSPTEIFGNPIIRPEHKSDVARLEILMKHGGMYIDTDVIVLKPFTPLRRFNITMGIEYHGDPGRLNNGIIIANKNAKFLRIWYDTYRNFTKREWDYHDSIIPYRLQFQYPRLIHVEEKTLNYPSGKEIDLIFKHRYDWSRNYAMHLWYRLHEFEHNQIGIRHMNTTFGEIARFIYYGSPKLFGNDTKQNWMDIRFRTDIRYTWK